MHMSTQLTVIESLSGRGRIYDADQLVDEVSYSLKEIEETPNIARSGGQDARDVEYRTLCGLVTPLRIEVLSAYAGVRLTLELQDGRRFDFAVTRVSEKNCLIKALTRLAR